MKLRCLRDCFVRNRYYEEDKVYELPDDFPTDHFQVEGKVSEPVPEVAPEPIEGVTPTTEAETGFVCSVCSKVCKSGFGLQAHQRSHKQGGRN